jgi:hypothetical protein
MIVTSYNISSTKQAQETDILGAYSQILEKEPFVPKVQPKYIRATTYQSLTVSFGNDESKHTFSVELPG